MNKKQNHFVLQIFIALIGGALLGLYYKPAVPYISWMGDIFIRALKMIILPLILSSIISGVANIGRAEDLGRLGLKTLSYYLMTSLLAILTGLFAINISKAGVGADLGLSRKVEGLDAATGSFGSTIMGIIPENIFSALSSGNMLPVIFFAIVFGFFVNQAPGKSAHFLTDFFQSVFEVMMKITMFIIRFTPLGVFAIIAKVMAEQQNLGSLVESMGLYMLTVIAALFFHAFVTLPLITRFIGKSKPFRHMANMRPALLTAFSTASSSATLPLTMNSIEERSGVSNKVTSFTLPLGATINMDGTALYECVAAIFIAQAYGVDLSFTEQALVVVTALLASIGAAGIPMAGLVMIAVILSAVGLPLEGIGLILAVDRILDMLRTATNVWSDSCGAVIIARSEGEKLKV